MTTTSSDGAFSFQPNKYGAPCFYCARRVHKGAGCCWPSPDLGKHATAHHDCLSAALAAGRPPKVGSSNATRADMGLPTLHDDMSHARTLKAIRDALKVVRLDGPPADVVAAVEAVRALLSRCPPPQDADGTAVPF